MHPGAKHSSKLLQGPLQVGSLSRSPPRVGNKTALPKQHEPLGPRQGQWQREEDNKGTNVNIRCGPYMRSTICTPPAPSPCTAVHYEDSLGDLLGPWPAWASSGRAAASICRYPGPRVRASSCHSKLKAQASG